MGRAGRSISLVSILIAAGVLASPAAARVLVRDSGEVAGPVDVLRLSSGQSGPKLWITITTPARIPLAGLSRSPSLEEAGRTRHICLRLGGKHARLLCVGATRKRWPAVFEGRMPSRGQMPRLRRAPELRVRRPAANRVEIRGPLRAFGLRPGRARVAALSDWNGEKCQPEAEPPPAPAPEAPNPLPPDPPPQDPLPPPPADLCRDRAPNSGMARMRVIRPRVVGCTRDERRLIARGPERRRRIALTFDDGPGPYTSQILRILREHDVRATFFVLGHAVGAYPSLARQELRAGHELGNHSMAHRVYPSGSDLGGTSARIRRATGFTPCTFRPPYGALTWATVSSAWSLGMSSILWDVDPMDWALPGSATIESRVLAGARDGSIVLMHDGGGPRGQTVAALPGIIGKLRDRGFRFVTVTELLGERPIWRP